eukprot:PhM_4_TR8958/c0_g1_i1/m.55104/K13341/PEX7, PTS2R; peroxin-7
MPSFAYHPKLAGYAVKFNPWEGSTLAVAAAENFGISGCGMLYFLKIAPDGDLVLDGMVPSADGCFDVSYSENDPNIVVAGCGDGIKIVDRQRQGVVQTLAEHQAEVYGVHWNPTAKDSFASGSWDCTVKVFPAGAHTSAVTYAEHTKEVYEVNWNPREATLLGSCSGDGSWRLYDVRTPRSVHAVPGHGGEIVLSLDWNRYDPNVLLTSSVDRSVKMWDVRRPQKEIIAFCGHEAAVRRVRCSPHSRNLFVTTGYDFRVCVWDTDRPQNALTQRYEQHREFVVGIDWSLVEPGVVATAAWDGLSYMWPLGRPPVPTHARRPPLPPFNVPPRTTPPRNSMQRGGMGPRMPPGPPPMNRPPPPPPPQR